MSDKRRPFAPEIATGVFGLTSVLLIGLIIVLPLHSRAGSFWSLFCSMCIVPSLLFTICFLIVSLIKRRWSVLLIALFIGLSFLPLKGLQTTVERQWELRFEETRELRQAFLSFMKQQQDTDESSPLNSVKLPPTLQTLSDRDNAYRYKDEDGKFFFSYSVFTHGIDNSFGYCWSESGKTPPRIAFPEIVRTRPLGNGWFWFSST